MDVLAADQHMEQEISARILALDLFEESIIRRYSCNGCYSADAIKLTK